jgi:hypothetical protein
MWPLRVSSFFSHRLPRKVPRTKRLVLPHLEVLEGRIVPDAYVWNGSINNDYLNGQNWINTRTLLPGVPGSQDTGDIPAGTPLCILNGTSRTIAGLSVEGQFDLFSKLTVTTGSSTGVFNTHAGGELDNVSSFDFYGSGTLQGQIDAGGSNITLRPSSSMTLGNGVLLTGLGAYMVNGPVVDNAALLLNVPLYLNNDGGVTTAGALIGSGSLDVGSVFDWTGGTLGLTGGVTLEPSSGFKTEGADPKSLTAGTLLSDAQLLDLGGTGALFILGTGTTLDVAAGQAKVSLPLITGGPPPTGAGSLVNGGDGNLKFQAPTGTLVNVNFSNTGNLNVASGSGLTLSSYEGAQPPLTVDLGGTLRLDSDLSLIGPILSSAGMIVASGTGHLNVGVGPSATASLTLLGGDTVLFGTLEVTGYGTLNGAGELDNDGNLILDLGSINTVGTYMQIATGTLEEHASGSGANSMLAVSGGAQLLGTLKLVFDGGYLPAHGDSWTVLTANSIGGQFDTVPADTTPSYGSTAVGLTEN